MKYKKLLFGRRIDNADHYSISNIEVENAELINDLRVPFDSHLKFGQHKFPTVFLVLL